MIDGEGVVALFDDEGVATVVETRSGIEIFESGSLETDVLHARRNVDLATPYAGAVSASLPALDALYAVASG